MITVPKRRIHAVSHLKGSLLTTNSHQITWKKYVIGGASPDSAGLEESILNAQELPSSALDFHGPVPPGVPGDSGFQDEK